MSSDLKGPEVSYVDLLDLKTYEASEEEAEAGGPKYSPLRPSSAGKCTRELAYETSEYLDLINVNKEIKDPEVTRLLSLGHYIEDSIIQQFKKYLSDYFRLKYGQQAVEGFDVNFENYPELNGTIEGKIDNTFVSESTHGLIDYKSKKDKFSKYFRTKWDEDDEKLREMKSVEVIGNSQKAYWIGDLEAFLEEVNDPFLEANFWQLNFYCNTEWAKRKGIDHGSIIQINKNDSRIREIRFAPSEGLYSRTYRKFQEAATAGEKGSPKEAPRDFNLGSIKCAFCNYASDCWSEVDKDPKKAFFETFPPKKWPQDTDRIDKEVGQNLDALYDDWLDGKAGEDKAKKAEDQMIKLMLDNGIEKVRFHSDGKVYQLKYLKSPKPHYELRRTKL